MTTLPGLLRGMCCFLYLVLIVISNVGAFSLNTRPVAASSPSTRLQQTSASDHIWTEQELLEYASQQGVVLSLTTLGPGYRAVARSKHDPLQILGYCEGFLRPGGKVLHLDKMEVFRKMVLRAREENPDGFSSSGTVFGIGILLGFICLLHGRENGYSVGEFLAIDDEESQHRKLVRYYARSGFKIIKYVGDDFKDIPDRLIWGGCGTLMREDISTLLLNWTRLLEKAKSQAS